MSMKRQQGVATLIMATMVLVSLTLITIVSAQVGVLETRISGNHQRSKQAEQASFAAMRQANIEGMNKQSLINSAGGTGVLNNLPLTLPSNDINLDGQLVGSFNATVSTINNGDFDRLQLNVTTTMSDNQSTRKMQQYILFEKLLRYRPEAALVVHGELDAGGSNLSIRNRNTQKPTPASTDDAGIWAGDPVVSAGSITMDVNGSVNATGIYDDQVDLRGIPKGEDFFVNFFGENRAQVKEHYGAIACTPCTQTNPNISLWQNKGGVLWIDGTLNLGGNFTLGSETDPIILIVDGEFHLKNNNAQVYGVVYVMNNADPFTLNTSSDRGTIHGSLIVDGSMNGNNNLNILYDDTTVMTQIDNMGGYTQLAGSWKDF